MKSLSLAFTAITGNPVGSQLFDGRCVPGRKNALSSGAGQRIGCRATQPALDETELAGSGFGGLFAGLCAAETSGCEPARPQLLQPDAAPAKNDQLPDNSNAAGGQGGGTAAAAMVTEVLLAQNPAVEGAQTEQERLSSIAGAEVGTAAATARLAVSTREPADILRNPAQPVSLNLPAVPQPEGASDEQSFTEAAARETTVTATAPGAESGATTTLQGADADEPAFVAQTSADVASAARAEESQVLFSAQRKPRAIPADRQTRQDSQALSRAYGNVRARTVRLAVQVVHHRPAAADALTPRADETGAELSQPSGQAEDGAGPTFRPLPEFPAARGGFTAGEPNRQNDQTDLATSQKGDRTAGGGRPSSGTVDMAAIAPVVGGRAKEQGRAFKPVQAQMAQRTVDQTDGAAKPVASELVESASLERAFPRLSSGPQLPEGSRPSEMSQPALEVVLDQQAPNHAAAGEVETPVLTADRPVSVSNSGDNATAPPDDAPVVRVDPQTPDAAIRQIVRSMRLRASAGRNLMQIQLKPEALGGLKIEVLSANSQVQIRMAAESSQIKQMLEEHLHTLKNELHQQGLELIKFEVLVQTNPDGTDNDQQSTALNYFRQQSQEDGRAASASQGAKQPAASEEEHKAQPEPNQRHADNVGIDFFA